VRPLGLLPSKQLLLNRQCPVDPRRGLHDYDRVRPVAFQEHAAFHLELEAAVAEGSWDGEGFEDVAAFAVVDRVVGEQAGWK
jgi:hypothetical protein